MTVIRVLTVLILSWGCFTGLAWRNVPSTVEPIREDVEVTIQMDGSRDRAELHQLSDGSYEFILRRFDGSTERLTPNEFAASLHGDRPTGGWLGVLFNISTPVGILWVSLGLLGQILFTARMLVQWLTSEKQQRSVVPPVFWWLSLVGASMLLAYFIWRRDIVGIIGQCFGWVVYLRNIHLIYFGRGRVSAASDPAPQPELE